MLDLIVDEHERAETYPEGIFSIFEGTNQIQRLVTGRSLSGAGGTT